MGFSQVLLKLLFKRACWGLGHRLGRGPTFCPHSSPSQESRASQQSPAWEELDRYRAGPLRSWTPPSARRPHKAGWDRGRSQASSARPAPAVSRQESHLQRRRGAGPEGVSAGPSTALARSSGPPFPGTPPLHGLTKRAAVWATPSWGRGRISRGVSTRPSITLDVRLTLQFLGRSHLTKAAPIRAGGRGEGVRPRPLACPAQRPAPPAGALRHGGRAAATVAARRRVAGKGGAARLGLGLGLLGGGGSGGGPGPARRRRRRGLEPDLRWQQRRRRRGRAWAARGGRHVRVTGPCGAVSGASRRPPPHHRRRERRDPAARGGRRCASRCAPARTRRHRPLQP